MSTPGLKPGTYAKTPGVGVVWKRLPERFWMKSHRSSAGSGTPVTVRRTVAELAGTMMLLGVTTGTYACGSTGIVRLVVAEAGFPKMPYAVSVAVVVPVIVMPVAPFAGYWYGAGATSIATPRAFSVGPSEDDVRRRPAAARRVGREGRDDGRARVDDVRREERARPARRGPAT